jgi:hypothetical protein
MDEKVRDALIEVLNTGKEALGAGKEGLSNSVGFVQQQAPDIAREIVAHQLGQALFGIVLGGVLAVGGIVLIKMGFERLQANRNKEISGFTILGVILTGLSAIELLSSIPQIILCLIAPKLCVIQYVTEFVKQIAR